MAPTTTSAAPTTTTAAPTTTTPAPPTTTTAAPTTTTTAAPTTTTQTAAPTTTTTADPCPEPDFACGEFCCPADSYDFCCPAPAEPTAGFPECCSAADGRVCDAIGRCCEIGQIACDGVCVTGVCCPVEFPCGGTAQDPLYCCPSESYEFCCGGPEFECCGLDSIAGVTRECDANGHCCEVGTPFFCLGTGTGGQDSCCATDCLGGQCIPCSPQACAEALGGNADCYVCYEGQCLQVANGAECGDAGTQVCCEGTCCAMGDICSDNVNGLVGIAQLTCVPEATTTTTAAPTTTTTTAEPTTTTTGICPPERPDLCPGPNANCCNLAGGESCADNGDCCASDRDACGDVCCAVCEVCYAGACVAGPDEAPCFDPDNGFAEGICCAGDCDSSGISVCEEPTTTTTVAPTTTTTDAPTTTTPACLPDDSICALGTCCGEFCINGFCQSECSPIDGFCNIPEHCCNAEPCVTTGLCGCRDLGEACNVSADCCGEIECNDDGAEGGTFGICGGPTTTTAAPTTTTTAAPTTTTTEAPTTTTAPICTRFDLCQSGQGAYPDCVQCIGNNCVAIRPGEPCSPFDGGVTGGADPTGVCVDVWCCEVALVCGDICCDGSSECVTCYQAECLVTSGISCNGGAGQCTVDGWCLPPPSTTTTENPASTTTTASPITTTTADPTTTTTTAVPTTTTTSDCLPESDRCDSSSDCCSNCCGTIFNVGTICLPRDICEGPTSTTSTTTAEPTTTVAPTTTTSAPTTSTTTTTTTPAPCQGIPDESPCRDGAPCEWCLGGQCVPNHAACNDDNQCTIDICDPDAAGTNGMGCVYINETHTPDAPVSCTALPDFTPVPGGVCCNGNCEAGPFCGECDSNLQCEDCETCYQGTCLPDPSKSGQPCDLDNDLCTLDTCNAVGVCVAGAGVLCTALDQCHDVGVCIATTGLCTNPEKDDDTPCNLDDNTCTRETCQSGVCTAGPPVACTNTCDGPDDLTWTQWICNTSTGACEAQTPVNCGDNEFCTSNDCDPASGCQTNPIPDGIDCGTCLTCQSGVCSSICTTELPTCCSASTDYCIGGGLTCCSNVAQCTATGVNGCLTPSCTGGACVYTPTNSLCNTPPNDDCYEAIGTCSAAGACSYTQLPDGTDCGDCATCQSGVCTDSCDEANDFKCCPGDGDTIPDFCADLLLGECCSVDDCADGVFCTDDACDPVTHTCSNTPNTDNCPPCEACIPGHPDRDENGCAFDCNSGVDREITIAAVPETCCDDFDPCTNDMCHPSGTCSNLTVPDSIRPPEGGICCNAGIHFPTGECCIDFDCAPGWFCEFLTHTCVDCLLDSHCDDNNICTTDVCEDDFTCSNTAVLPLICNDNNPCTTDTCSLDQCHHTPVLNSTRPSSEGGICCNDGMYLPTGECCDDGDCPVGEFCETLTHTCVDCLLDFHCNDDDICTTDVCEDDFTCSNTPVVPLICDDDNPCTTDSCSADACTNTPVANSIEPAEGGICCDTGIHYPTGECCANADCVGDLGGEFCDTSTHTCVECIDTQDCVTSTLDEDCVTCNAGTCEILSDTLEGGGNRTCDHPAITTDGVGICCSGVCVDEQADEANCGVCGNFCDDPPATCFEATGDCEAGVCVYDLISDSCYIDDVCYSDGDPHPTDECLECNPVESQDSWSNIADDTLCDGDTGICCTGVCVDPTGDETHCGTCGNPCDATFTCCPTGVLPDLGISGACVDTDVNSSHCGACLSVCDDPPADCFEDPGDCEAGTCTYDLLPSNCFIDNTCIPADDPNPANDCQVCDPNSSTSAWTDVADLSACDTGGAGTCCDGICRVGGECCLTTDCPATGVDCGINPSCTGFQCVYVPDDECTATGVDECLDSTCNADGTCSYTPSNPLCDDPPNTLCYPAIGVCSELGECSYTPITNGTSCNDGLFCTTGETCQAGVCTPSATSACTGFNEVCNEATDACDCVGGLPRVNGICQRACTQNSQCTSYPYHDTCADCVNGRCGPVSGKVPGSSWDDCTIVSGADGYCDYTTGSCLPGQPNGTVCIDQKQCASDNCNTTSGSTTKYCGACRGPNVSCTTGTQCCGGSCTGGVCACSAVGVACSADTNCCSGRCDETCMAKLPNGDPCTEPSDCVSNLCLESGTTDYCTCRPITVPCSTDLQCCSGRCDSTCLTRLADGEICTESSDCLSNVCVDAGATDYCTCRPSSTGLTTITCTTNAQCCSNVCVDVPGSTSYCTCSPLGAQCSTTGQCCTGTCTGGICLGGDGETCNGDAQCASGRCDDTCQAKLANGELCDEDSDCISGRCDDTCEDKLANGEPCSEPSDCVTGACFNPGGGQQNYCGTCVPAGGLCFSTFGASTCDNDCCTGTIVPGSYNTTTDTGICT